ncbi:hypothetical protein CJ255_03900 [Candidatus Viridilinea mediisalina]|uniref:Uncharacterized protein n=2 Tax=Candidatus Viridilinea mediisalina TaxID=2024553 RepID=A0A2A6RNB7_9CHLR|nr:hypothetical protein CJ255_03900 [Candidatus Viridilinea mediisalina]
MNTLLWNKTVQTLSGARSVASRPACCADPACAGATMRLRSAEGQQVALPYHTYGYDVLTRIGWLRQTRRATYEEIHAELRTHVQLSYSQVRSLYRDSFLPLLACHERQQTDRVAAIVTQYGGLVLALDGMAPEGGEPQLWVLHELLSGVVLRSGWMSRQDQSEPALDETIAAVAPEEAPTLPDPSPTDPTAPPYAGETPVVAAADEPTAPPVQEVVQPRPHAAHAPHDPIAQQVTTMISHVLCRVRYLLTWKGRPPLRLAGIEVVAELEELITRGTRWLTHRHDPCLAALVCGLQHAVTAVESTVATLRREAEWIADICDILAPVEGTARTGAEVAQHLQTYLNHLDPTESDPHALAFQQHLRKVSASYWSGLFHCYDDPNIPQTNNGLESRFRDTQRRILRTTGQKGRTRRILHRIGAWELLNLLPTEEETLNAMRQIAPSDLADERQRLYQHLERFRLHTRTPRQTKTQLDRLEQEWLALPPNTTA